MDNIKGKLIKNIASTYEIKEGAYNLRENGKLVERNTTENIDIITKKDKPGIDILIKANTKGETVQIPVLITESGIEDKVYNDFYIGKNSEVLIIAGCGIHNDEKNNSGHNGIHRFFLEENAKVKYVEKHIGTGKGLGKKVLNPETVVNLKKGAILEIETYQIEGIDSTIRTTKGKVGENASLIIIEKIMTHGTQLAKTIFNIKLEGKNSSVKVISRAIAKENSNQKFVSKIEGNNVCFGHVECDAIIMDKAIVSAIPEIIAKNVDAKLIHEATIGKIAGEQLIKLMTLGFTKKEAEKEIIAGFLK